MTSRESHGRKLRGASFGRFDVSEILMPSPLGLREHVHDAAQVCFVLAGEYTESGSRCGQALGPGSVLYRPAATAHANDFGKGEVLTLLVSYQEDLVGSDATGGRSIPSLVLHHLKEDLVRELRRDDDSSWELEALGLLIGSTIRRWLSGAADTPPGWLADAASIVAGRFRESITVKAIADQVGVHRTTLAAGFRRWYATSVGEEIRRRRVVEAVRLLRETRLPISAIAIDCGFHDQSHLTRAFNRQLRTTPLQVRRSEQ